jgi:hypothetical protein
VAARVGWQLAGLIAARVDDPLADVETVEITRALAAAPADVWPLLTAHELYGRRAGESRTVSAV